MTPEPALQLVPRPSDDIENAHATATFPVKIDRYAMRERCAGRSISRYHVTVLNESPWDIEIIQEGDSYRWTLAADVSPPAKKPGSWFATLREALDAAVRYVQDLETGMW